MLRKLFGGKGRASDDKELSIEDLIVLERYAEAIERLESKLRSQPRDLHSHLRLAEVFTATGQGAKALDQYLLVADAYTEDGFYDKALALLGKVTRLAPGDDTIVAKTMRIQRLKDLEHSRVLAIEGLIRATATESPLDQTSPVEAQQVWRGIAGSKLVERLAPDQLRRLFSGAAIQDWNSGEIVAERGSGVERMFVIANGVVEAMVARSPSGQVLQLRTFTRGDLFGERALLEHKPWPATYRVVERAKLLRIDRAGLEKALAGNPDPRALFEALRAQHADRDVAAAVEKLLASAD